MPLPITLKGEQVRPTVASAEKSGVDEVTNGVLSLFGAGVLDGLATLLLAGLALVAAFISINTVRR